jgi:uncharacterized protein (TIGR02118 family)
VYNVVWFARFRAGMAREDARRHWREVHAPLALRASQITAYVQSHAVAPLGPDGVGDGALGFDGYSSCWFVDEETYLELLRSQEWEAVREDSPNIFDSDWFDGMCAVLDQRTIVAGDYGPFKAVWVVRFKDEIRGDPARTREAHEYWVATHGEDLGRKVPGIGRYVQNHCVAALGEQGADPGVELRFDGYSECWFEDREAFEYATSSSEWQAMSDDAAAFCDVDYTLGMSAIVEENVVKDGRAVAR